MRLDDQHGINSGKLSLTIHKSSESLFMSSLQENTESNNKIANGKTRKIGFIRKNLDEINLIQKQTNATI